MPLAPPIDAIQQPAVGIYGLPVGASAGAMVLLTAAEIRAISGAGTSSFDGAYASLSGVPSTFTPSAHTHGNITNAGAIGSTTGLPIVTTASGVLTAGSFGTTAGTFAAGDDSRITGALSTSTAAATYAVIAAGQPTSGTVGQVLAKNSGTNYDSSWTSLVLGDRYLSTSTTSNAVSNGTKTFTIGTGLAYTPTQNITIAYNAANHMHGEVVTYNSGTGVLVVDINYHTGTGTYTSWVVNVGGVTPVTVVSWGDIIGTLGTQSDLSTALNAKLEITTAASTYLPLAGGTLTGDLKFTDATYDIGKTGATRPRDGFFSRNVTVGSVLTLSTSGLNIPTTTFGPAKLTVFGNDLYYDPGGHTAGGHIFRTASSTSTLLTLYSTGATFSVPVIASIVSPASHVLEQRNGTNAQTLRVYNTYTSSTSYERLNIKGKASANFEIGPENGSAGGTLRGLTLGCYPAGTSTIVGWAQFRPNASTGALEAFYLGPIADSTAVGGDNRGTQVVDLQIYRTASTQVAAGNRSVISGGERNTITSLAAVSVISGGYQNVINGFGYYSVIGGGYQNTLAGSPYSVISGGSFNTVTTEVGIIPGGVGASTTRYCQESTASGYFAAAGDAQSVRLRARIKTTDATPTTLMCDGISKRLTIPSGKIMFCDILISGIKSDGSASACYKRKVAIKNVGGTTALVGTVEAIGTDIEDNVLTDVAITADNTNDALDISVTGISGETWRWVAVIEGLEIAYGV